MSTRRIRKSQNSYLPEDLRSGRWDSEGEKVADYRVVITEGTRHGRTKRHTFVVDDDDDRWTVEPDIPKLMERGHNAGYGQSKNKPLDTQKWGLARKPLPAKVPLAPSFDVSSSVLIVVLDALVAAGRHQVDLGDMKVVVSQLGSRIAALDSLPDEKRRLAEAALYTEILGRCTTI